MIRTVAIEITQNAFLPEAYAYRDMFRSKGIECNLVNKGSEKLTDYDLVVLFHGFHPFWRRYPQFVIGEYHSLSTGRFGRVKDVLKRLFNVRANYYIFLNDVVRAKFFFSRKVPHSLRGMGFFKSDSKSHGNKEFDVIYCGSYRSGVMDHILRLADMGLRVAVVGFDCHFEHNNIVSFGKVSPLETGEFMRRARWGLNYTPDRFPLNIQDSTKVIEYCAAGLGVITNRYRWVDCFEKERGGKFLGLNEVSSAKDVREFEFVVPDVSDLEWKRKVEVLFEEINAHFSLVD